MFTHFFILLNVYAVRIFRLWLKQRQHVPIVKTFEQLIHLFITMSAEKKMSFSQVISSANRILFKKMFLQSRATLKKIGP